MKLKISITLFRSGLITKRRHCSQAQRLCFINNSKSCKTTKLIAYRRLRITCLITARSSRSTERTTTTRCRCSFTAQLKRTSIQVYQTCLICCQIKILSKPSARDNHAAYLQSNHKKRQVPRKHSLSLALKSRKSKEHSIFKSASGSSFKIQDSIHSKDEKVSSNRKIRTHKLSQA